MQGRISVFLSGLLFALIVGGCDKKQPQDSWLSNRGRVVRSTLADAKKTHGTEWIEAAELPDVERAMLGREPRALVRSMRAHKVDALWSPLGGALADDGSRTLRSRFARAEWVPGFVTQSLQSKALLVKPSASTDRVPDSAGMLGRVARLILAGESPPPVASFPVDLTKSAQVEVAVLLRDHGALRLWRSARAQSIAKALLLASVAARDRWAEKEVLLGGALTKHLATLDVEVWEFVEDGSIEIKDDRTIEKMLTEAHGVGYEQPGRWRYLLPEQVDGFETNAKALRSLFASNELPEQSVSRTDLRLYRFVTRQLAVSRGGVSTANPKAKPSSK